MTTPASIKIDRLLGRIAELGRIGALPGGGVCRLALTAEDREGRDLLAHWMRELGLEVSVDRIGNIFGVRRGRLDVAPVMVGSHIDSVATGGLYDGALGVLSGLELITALNDAGAETDRPLAVAAFTNEEGARFAPDMMGSLVHVGGMALEDALAIEGIDGVTVGEALTGIGYAGEMECGAIRPHAFVELHIEQGPILEAEELEIGVVEGVQGISWSELVFTGSSAHAGTTPMRLRRDAGRAAMAIAVEITRLAEQMGEDQVCTVGSMSLHPNLVNVVPDRAVITVDLRNPDEDRLRIVEAGLSQLMGEASAHGGVEVTSRSLARFEPVAFSPRIVDRVEAFAQKLGYSTRRMYAGAGHDAQMLARVCPAGMIFIPSRNGLSHNIAEFSSAKEIEQGAVLLLATVLDLARIAGGETADDETLDRKSREQ